MTHQGKGDWEGRAGVLLPVTWIEGWRILGKPGSDQIGEMVWGGTKPMVSTPAGELFTSDTFDGASLQPARQWRYQPRAESCSLTGRTLRLSAFEPLRGAGFDGVRNVLSQRSARSLHAEVTVQMGLSGLADGEEAGLPHFAKTDSRIAVVRRASVRGIVRIDGRERTDGPSLSVNTVWLRSTWGVDGLAHFAYSLDGSTFTELGLPYRMTWGSYRGDRIGLYTMAGSSGNGYVDFSSFRYRVEH